MDINVIYGEGAANNAAPAGFYTAVNYVVSYLDQLFTNDVTININISYGAILDPYTGKYSKLSSDDLGESFDNNETAQSYGAVRSALLAENVPGASTLPAASPISGSLYMGSAEAKALGLDGASAALDGAVGISASTAWDFTPNTTPTANEYYLVGTLEHEITEVMGRVSYLDSSGEYGVADLYRYSAAGVRSDAPGGNGSTAYFSIDNGATNLGSWNNQISNGDLADWYPQGPVSGGNDAFNDYSSPGVINTFSSSDVTLMEALGWSIIPATPSISTLVGQPVNGATIEVQGTGQAGDAVTLYQGNTIVGSGTVGTNGTFDIITGVTFADGVVSLTATETDSDNETSPASSAFSVDVDPTAPTLTGALGQPLNGGPIEVQGTGEVGETVTLYEGATAVGSSTVASNGSFDITTTATFSGGVMSLTAVETDKANLSSAPCAVFDVSVGLVETDQTYQTILQRMPTNTEVTAALATDSTVGLSGVIASVVDSPEAQQNVYPITQIILLATGSFPTASQLAGWMPAVQSSVSLDQMALAFVASTAFGNTYNNGSAVNPNAKITAPIVTEIIEHALGTTPTTAQVNAWVSTGLTIDQVFVDFALGDQYSAAIESTMQQNLTALVETTLGGSSGIGVPPNGNAIDGLTSAEIGTAYQAVLQRAPTSAEVNAALSIDAAVGNVGVIATIVNSPEAQQNVYPIVQIVDLATGNPPTAAQLAGWVPAVESGVSLDQMATAFVASTSFGNTYNNGSAVNPNASITAPIVTEIIENALGTMPTAAQVDAWVNTGLTIDEVFVDFALGAQYSGAIQSAVQDYLTATVDNEAGFTTIDGSEATGALTLGTRITPLTQAGLTVLGGSGMLSVAASGAGDTITELNTSTAGGSITASGGGDTINVANGMNTITANGPGDHINLGVVATGTLITDGQIIHANGIGDTITFAATAADGTAVTWGGASTVDGGNSTTGIGTSSTINFGNNLAGGSETIVLTGDLAQGTTAGGTSTTSIDMTTLGHVVDASGDLIVLDNATTELLAGANPVNVGSTMSLAEALDLAAASAASSQGGTIAAHTGVVDWFQYGLDTYLVEAINATALAASHTALAATDEVIQIVGTVNLVGESLAGHTLTL